MNEIKFGIGSVPVKVDAKAYGKILREMQKGAVPEKRRTEAEETHTSGYHARS